MRINKFLADAGVASRREADRLIEAGKISLNGRVAKLGDRVEEGDEVEFEGRPVRPPERRTTIAFHKPVGVIVTTAADSRDNIMEALRRSSKPLPPARLFPVGRLDVASSGLILLTDDPALADRLMRPAAKVEKEYDVTADREITPDFLERMAAGVRLVNMPPPQRVVTTQPARISQTGASRFLIIITEGKNRQIRRMCEALGYGVKRLVRVRVGGVRLGDLPEGEWRLLAGEELDSLNGV